MSILDTLKFWGCSSWYLLPDVTDKINSNKATINGTQNKYTLNNRQCALYLNGATYIDNLEQTLNQTFTLSAWIYQTATAVVNSSNVIYNSTNSTNTSYALLVIDSANCVNFICRQDSTTVNIKYDTPILNNNWYHILVIHTSAGSEIYVNGICKAITETALTVNFNTHTDQTIGCLAVSKTRLFTGLIKNVMLFDGFLDLDMVRQLYYMTFIDSTLLSDGVDINDTESIYVEEESTTIPENTANNTLAPIFTLNPTFDTFIWEGDPDNTASGSEYYNEYPTLYIGDNGGLERNVLLQFECYNLTLPVANATLKLYQAHVLDTHARNILFCRFTTPIGTTTGWDNLPNIITNTPITYSLQPTDGWIELNVTSLVNLSPSGCIGIFIDITDINTFSSFKSMNSEYIPQLIITR